MWFEHCLGATSSPWHRCGGGAEHRLTWLLCSQPPWWYTGETGQVSCHPTPSTAHEPTPTLLFLYDYLYDFSYLCASANISFALR